MAMLCIGIIFLIGRSSSLSEIDAVEEQQIGSRQEASAEKAADRISAGPDNAKTESLESESTRITSYNVCYTKLLREHAASWKRFLR